MTVRVAHHLAHRAHAQQQSAGAMSLWRAPLHSGAQRNHHVSCCFRQSTYYSASQARYASSGRHQGTIIRGISGGGVAHPLSLGFVPALLLIGDFYFLPRGLCIRHQLHVTDRFVSVWRCSLHSHLSAHLINFCRQPLTWPIDFSNGGVNDNGHHRIYSLHRLGHAFATCRFRSTHSLSDIQPRRHIMWIFSRTDRGSAYQRCPEQLAEE